MKVVCGECGSDNVKTKQINYAVTDGNIRIGNCKVPLRICQCGFEYLDCETEAIVDNYTKEYFVPQKDKRDIVYEVY